MLIPLVLACFLWVRSPSVRPSIVRLRRTTISPPSLGPDFGHSTTVNMVCRQSPYGHGPQFGTLPRSDTPHNNEYKGRAVRKILTIDPMHMQDSSSFRESKRTVETLVFFSDLLNLTLHSLCR